MTAQHSFFRSVVHETTWSHDLKLIVRDKNGYTECLVQNNTNWFLLFWPLATIYWHFWEQIFSLGKV